MILYDAAGAADDVQLSGIKAVLLAHRQRSVHGRSTFSQLQTKHSVRSYEGGRVREGASSTQAGIRGAV